MAGVGERGNPGTVDLVRAPTQVIRMQVRVHDGVDRPGVEAGVGQPLEERPGHLMPEREGAHLAIPDARIDEHRRAPISTTTACTRN